MPVPATVGQHKKQRGMSDMRGWIHTFSYQAAMEISRQETTESVDKRPGALYSSTDWYYGWISRGFCLRERSLYLQIGSVFLPVSDGTVRR